MTTASSAPKDGNETSPEVGFCDGTTLQLSAPSWVKWSILAPADAEAPGCPDQEENLGVYALPGMDGGAAQVFAGGSNIGISAKSAHPELALSALEIILSDEFQTIYGENGLVPAKLSLADTLGTDEVAQAIAAAAGNAKLTPASPNWADVEASRHPDRPVRQHRAGRRHQGARRGRRRGDRGDPQQLVGPVRLRGAAAPTAAAPHPRPGRATTTHVARPDRGAAPSPARTPRLPGAPP